MPVLDDPNIAAAKPALPGMIVDATTRPNDVAKRKFARTFVQSVVYSDLPIFGGGFSTMARIVFRSTDDFEMTLWRSETPDSLDDLVDSVFKRISCSELALRIGARISKRLEEGLSEPVSFDEISEAFPGTTEAGVRNACGELDDAELVTLILGINDSGQVHAVPRLFEAFDPIVHSTNPRVDAAEIARYLVSLPANRVIAPNEIMAKFGWNKRRLNPVLAIIGEMIGNGRASMPIGAEFFLTRMAPNLSERVALRRFADRILGPVRVPTGG